jgi:hypothetical protein
MPLQIAVSLALAAGVFLAARNSSFEWAVGLALAAGVLVGYHGYVHDGVLFLPALMAFLSAKARHVRFLAVTLATPIPWCILPLVKPLNLPAQLLMLAFVVGATTFLWRKTRGVAEQVNAASS